METQETKPAESAADNDNEDRAIHENFMREALAMAELALSSSETPVGCVLVYQNAIIARGMNATKKTLNGTRHAEFEAITNLLSIPADEDDQDINATPISESISAPELSEPESLSKPLSDLTMKSTPDSNPEPNPKPNPKSDSELAPPKKFKHPPQILQSCTLYVTIEPCIMCASLLRQYQIRKVYFGAVNQRFGGTGGVLNIHSDPGVEPGFEVSGGWLREEAILLLRRFYGGENADAPKPRKKEGRKVNLVVEPLQGGKGEGVKSGDG